MDGRGLLFSAIFPITKAELPLHLSRLPLAALSLTNFRIASHSVHMTRVTFKVEYLNQPLLKKQGLIEFSIPFYLSLTSLLTSLSSLLLVLEVITSVS
jgi:hypothetical protein